MILPDRQPDYSASEAGGSFEAKPVEVVNDSHIPPTVPATVPVTPVDHTCVSKSPLPRAPVGALSCPASPRPSVAPSLPPPATERDTESVGPETRGGAPARVVKDAEYYRPGTCDVILSFPSKWVKMIVLLARLYRYFHPRGGQVKASPEAMKMWGTKEGRAIVDTVMVLVLCWDSFPSGSVYHLS